MDQYKLHQWLFANQDFGNTAASNSPWALVSALLPNVFVLTGIILFILIIGAGFVIVTSSGNPEKTQQGKQVATFAIIGFAIVFTSYWLIQIVGVLTGIQILGGPTTP